MKRRNFFKNLTLGSAGLILLPSFHFPEEGSFCQVTDDPEKLFLNPPDSYGPWAAWFWVNGHVTKEGITLDLEQMERIGIHGIFCLDYLANLPRGPVEYGGDEWMDAVEHTLKEAERLGLVLVFRNSCHIPGMSHSGIPPEMTLQQLVWSVAKVESSGKVKLKLPQPLIRRGFYNDIAVLAYPTPPDDHLAVIDPGSLVELASYMNKKGVLNWNPPGPGNWTIIRIGHTSAFEDPEFDRFRKEALDLQFDRLTNKMVQRFQPWIGKSFRGFCAENQIPDHLWWSKGFDAEFIRRKKYSMNPWVLKLTGKVIGSAEQTMRFLFDYKQTQNELLSENYFGYWNQWCQQKGVSWNIVPTGEKMSFAGEPHPPALVTSSRKWTDTPEKLKLKCDDWYIIGFDSVVISPYVHQPYSFGLPGMSTGLPHLGRHNTWTEQSKGWTDYLRRTQFLLQQGSLVADVCIFQEDSPSRDFSELSAIVPAGFTFEVAGMNALPDCSIREGKIVLPGGKSYTLGILTSASTILTGTLKLLAELVEQGMNLIVTCKPESSPSLADSDEEFRSLSLRLFGNLDGKTIRQINRGKGMVFWGFPDKNFTDRLTLQPDFSYTSENQDTVVKFVHKTFRDADLYFVSNKLGRREKMNCSFRTGHRQPEIWNCETGEIVRVPIFETKKERLQMPLELLPFESLVIILKMSAAKSIFKKITRDGRILIDNEPFINKEGQTIVNQERTIEDLISPLTFHADDTGSLKGLFLRNGIYNILTTNEEVEENHTVYADNCFEIPLDTSWVVHFPEGSGAPVKIELNKLESLIENDDFNVRHFSGTCVYSTLFYLTDSDFIDGRKFFLDLGKVDSVARINVNKEEAGLVWKNPYRTDVTKMVRTGENILSVEVTNLWHNRRIGDEYLLVENDYGEEGFIKTMPDWYVKNQSKPGERKSFSVYHEMDRSDPLVASGLTGPVKLILGSERFL
jgi:hypothetical protein